MQNVQPCFRRPPMTVFRWLAAWFLALSVTAVTEARAADPAIHVRSADVYATAEGYALDAAFQVELGETLEEALHRGLTLHFVTEFQLLYERWYLFGLWNKTISSFDLRYRLAFNALTRQYRVTTGALTQNVETLQEAIALMARIRNRQVASRDELEPGTVYLAQLRLRLDSSQLPKPFQLSSIGSKSWNVSSDWYRWTVRP